MKVLSDLNNQAACLLSNILDQAHSNVTYQDAIKFLKNEQTKTARNGLPDRPSEIDRAILHLADAIYGEAIFQLNAEAKEQPIKEA